MKLFIFVIQILIIMPMAANVTIAQTKIKAKYSVKHLKDGTVVIDDFEDDSVGSIPHKWYNRNGERQPFDYPAEEKESYRYRVEKEDSNQYLHYEGTSAKHLNFPIINKDNIDIYKTPILSWQWRVSEIPAGANEDVNDKNDAAASIYVVFDMGHVLFKKVPKSIRYTWSSTLKKGTELSKFFGNQKIIVVQSGRDGLGKWHTFSRNIVEDYKRLFGDDPPHKPLAILILSDGDSTGHPAEADYDNIQLQRMMY